MSGLPGDYVVDAPKGFFGRGESSRSFPNKDAFYAYVQALIDLGKTVTVHEDHAPVFAVVQPRKAPVPAFDMSRLSCAGHDLCECMFCICKPDVLDKSCLLGVAGDAA